MAGSRAPRRNVAFSKPEEPSFLREFKAKVGYREPATVESKKEAREEQGGEEEDAAVVDRRDELPTVVVLGEGDLSQEEFEELVGVGKSQGEMDAGEGEGEGKVVFRKPVKRGAGEGWMKASSTSKKAKSSQPNRRDSGSKGVRNTSLLSFSQEDED